MTKQKDDFEQMIKENLYREAEAIEKEVNESGVEDISAEQKEAIRLKLKNRIDAYERERVYAGLSEEDREALELGRKVREEQKAGKKKKRIKRWIRYVSAAAVVAIVCAYGAVTSVGHGEKFASTIEQIVGERKIVQIDSDEGNRVIEQEEEEKAYQQIKEIFGIEIVRLVRYKGMKFIHMDMNESLQVAEILYQYNGENLWYVIGAGYYESSFGIDTEDKIMEKEDINVGNTMAELTVYQRKNSGKEKCSVHFTYQKWDYFLAGNISKGEFKNILKNLYFF